MASTKRVTSNPERAWQERLIGQDHVVQEIYPYVRQYNQGLSIPGRPAGVFLLLGPTGVGKTRTVEALAEVLHGSAKSLVRIDCGEFQMEHEVAKLIGAPPGYLGHRETVPLLNKQKLSSVTSDNCSLSLVLFDEIEKAAPSMMRLMLGMLDKATLTLGDGTVVDFSRSMIFMTSNLGAAEMSREVAGGFGLGVAAGAATPSQSRLTLISQAAAKRRFAPEFINRIDAMVTYNSLSKEDMAQILELEVTALQRLAWERWGPAKLCGPLELTPAASAWITERGFSPQWGARELKRVLHKHVWMKLGELGEKHDMMEGITFDVKKGSLEVRVHEREVHMQAITHRTK